MGGARVSTASALQFRGRRWRVPPRRHRRRLPCGKVEVAKCNHRRCCKVFWIDVVSRIIHVFMAITLLGGSLFTLVAVLPALGVLDEDARKSFSEAVTGRWKRVVHLGVLLFLVSGFYNYFRAMDAHTGDGRYHMLVGIKMILALFVFFVASALVGRSAKLQPMRDAKQKWLSILVLVASSIVGLSGFLKIRGVPASVPDAVVVEPDAAN